PDFLSKCRAIDRASLDDPAGVAARFAIFSGAPATEREAQDMQASVADQARLSEANNLVAQSGVKQLPDFVQAEIAHVLDSGQVPGKGDLKAELQNAVAAANENCQQGVASSQRLAGAEAAIEQFRSTHGASYDRYESKIADLFQSGKVPRTGNHLVDLQRALDQASVADRARAASRSVSGGPTPRATRQRSTSNDRSHLDDVAEDVARALRSASV